MRFDKKQNKQLDKLLTLLPDIAFENAFTEILINGYTMYELKPNPAFDIMLNLFIKVKKAQERKRLKNKTRNSQH